MEEWLFVIQQLKEIGGSLFPLVAARYIPKLTQKLTNLRSAYKEEQDPVKRNALIQEANSIKKELAVFSN